MAINPNELVLERVREVTFSDLSDGSIIGRLTSVEESSLKTSAEGEDVTDAVGSVITTIYRAKNGEFTATNSLFSLDLAAQQFGASKKLASDTDKIIVPATETLEIKDGKVTLAHVPVNELKHIYKLENKQLSEKFEVATTAGADNFAINGQEITVPTGITEGTIYVEYEYETTSGAMVTNKSNDFPQAVGVKIYAIFRDTCNENVKYAGTIVAKKGKLDPSQIDIALTSTGKHAFTVKFMKDYCAEDADLFSIIIAE